MRIDTHAHVMFKPFCGRQPAPVNRLLDDWQECGLDGGWVSGVDAMLTGELDKQKLFHDQLAEVVRQHPRQVGAFCTVNPSAMEDAAAEVQRCVCDLGFIGVKIHPWLQAVSVVANPGMDLVMRVAGELGVPVLFHDGTPPYSAPSQIGYLAARHPGTQVILGHAGLLDLWREAAAVGRELGNVWLQPTAAPEVAIRAALQAVGPQRVLFGTDAGFWSARAIRYGIARFRAALGAAVAEQVMTQNPKRLLAGDKVGSPHSA